MGQKWVRLPKHKAGYDLELLNQSREYIMELLKPVYQVFSDKKSTVKDYVLAIYKLIVCLIYLISLQKGAGTA